MVTSRRCGRLITLVPFGSRFEHFDECKTQRVECFLERCRSDVRCAQLRWSQPTSASLARVRFVNRLRKVTGSRVLILCETVGRQTIFIMIFLLRVQLT